MEDNIKVKFVSVEEGITALGFRRVAAIARKLNPGTDIYFVTPGNLYSLRTHLFPSYQITLGDKDIDKIAQELAKADLLCFSSMTPASAYVTKISQAVKRKNPKIFILWGGVHCILYPNTAIKYVDAICTGEGEIPFEMFYRAFLNKRCYLETPNMWFRVKKGIIRNPFRSLNTPKELNSFPHLFYDFSCQIYDRKLKIFRQFTRNDYLNYNGLSYRTVWTLGCPFSCVFCANDAFVSINKSYRLIRHSSADYVLKEIEEGLKIHPFVSTIIFYDDNFIAIPTTDLKVFAREYKKRVNLPFVVFGLHPNMVSREKIELLGKAGMNRGRMGIQSGSEKTLSFYQRQTPINNIKRSAKVLALAAKKYDMIPPSYDIISDNPLETKKELINSLKFLYKLKRPYTLTIFSLRVFPKTRLYDYFGHHPSTDIRELTSSYLETRPTLNNILLYLLAIFKPPKLIFFWLLQHVKGYQEKQCSYPVLYWIMKFLYLSSRAFSHLIRLDFSTIPGPWGFYLWKIGLIRLKLNRQRRKFRYVGRLL